MLFSIAMRGIAGALVAIACSGLARAQNVWIVDDDPGPDVDFAHPAEVDEIAQSGDVILIREGVYRQFQGGFQRIDVDDKGLSFIAEPGADVIFLELIVEVVGVPAGEAVVFRGIEFRTSTLEISNSPGVTWIEDCVLSAPEGSALGVPRMITTAANLVVVNSRLLGPNAAPPDVVPLDSGPAVLAVSSEVTLYDTLVGGGNGGTTTNGSHAFDLFDGFLYASGCTFTGGAGTPNAAGHLRLRGTDPEAVLADTTLGPLGASIEAGTLSTLSTLHRTVRVNSPVHEGETVSLGFEAQPGELVLLLVGGDATPLFDPGLGTTSLLEPPFLVLNQGLIPASGEKLVQFPLGEIGADGLSLFLQAAYFDLGALELFAGGGSQLTVLDAPF